MAKIYKVTIRETVEQEFEVKANDLCQAVRLAEQKYNNGEFVLEPGELVEKRVKASDPESGDAFGWIEF